MVRHTSGILCTPLTAADAARLRLPPMVSVNDAPLQTAFTVSVDYRYGLTTGISAEERTGTIRALANRNAGPEDFVRPGHIFPLDRPRRRSADPLRPYRGRDRPLPAGRGRDASACWPSWSTTTARSSGCRTASSSPRQHGLRIVSIADLIEYRQRRDQLVRRVASFEIATAARPGHGDRLRDAVRPDPARGAGRSATSAAASACSARIHREQPLGDLLGWRRWGSRRPWRGSAARGAACSCCCATLWSRSARRRGAAAARKSTRAPSGACGNGARSASARRSCATSASSRSACWPPIGGTISACPASGSRSPRPSCSTA